MTSPVAQFQGAVSCQQGAPPFLLTLTGPVADNPDTLTLTLTGTASPPDVPAVLESPVVVRRDAGSFRISAAGRDWDITARAVQLHYDVAASFYRSVIPRPVPWTKRIFWRVVLGLASNPLGKRLLLALRR
jgi:hypothetical protein